jgi:PKD repeat protein
MYAEPVLFSFIDTSINNPTSLYWDFGDGSTSLLQNPSHTYTHAGNYSVRLTGSNPFGSTTAVKTIIVIDPLRANFTASPSDGQNPLTIQFTDTSTGNPTKWLWDIDDDGSYDTSVKNPEFTYNRTGMYSVRLNVYDEYGRSNTTVKINLIKVGQRPAILITTVSPTTPVPTPLPCTFFSLPCQWIGAFIIIVAMIIAAVVIKPKKLPVIPDNTGSTGPKMLSELKVEPKVELVVRRGIEVTGMDFGDYGIRLDVDAGIEFPEEKDGKGG